MRSNVCDSIGRAPATLHGCDWVRIRPTRSEEPAAPFLARALSSGALRGTTLRSLDPQCSFKREVFSRIARTQRRTRFPQSRLHRRIAAILTSAPHFELSLLTKESKFSSGLKFATSKGRSGDLVRVHANDGPGNGVSKEPTSWSPRAERRIPMGSVSIFTHPTMSEGLNEILAKVPPAGTRTSA